MGRTVVLTKDEITELDIQDPETEKHGGYQRLLVKLQKRLNRGTGELYLDDKDLQRIPKYAYDYGRGGWQNRLERIFVRELGSRLGREANNTPTSGI